MNRYFDDVQESFSLVDRALMRHKLSLQMKNEKCVGGLRSPLIVTNGYRDLEEDKTYDFNEFEIVNGVIKPYTCDVSQREAYARSLEYQK